MLSPLALAPHVEKHGGQAVLDMCSSPGGKSSFLASLAGEHGFVMANEPNRERHQTLKRNLARLQLANAGVCQYPGESLPVQDGAWPCILLDPPCSGWGTTDKHPNAARIWQGEKVAPLVELQRLLLAEAVRLLAPGGALVYSTCTTNVQENEEQVLYATRELGLELDPLPEPEGYGFEAPHLDGCEGCLRVDQELSQAQGHFAVRLLKPGELPERAEHPLPGEPLPVEEISEGPWDMTSFKAGELRLFGENVHFVHEQAALLPSSFRWQGLQLGRYGKGGKGGFRPLPRARGLLPAVPLPGDLVAEEPGLLVRLLQGQSLEAPAASSEKGGLCGLYFRASGMEQPLPLGWIKRKGKRLLWAER